MSGSSERGFVLPQLVIAMTALAAVALTAHLSTRARTERTVAVETSAQLETARRGLIGYAMAHRRLPCPARGGATAADADFGRSAPETATTACTAATGILPWRTLGMDETQSLDGWGRRISYRVFSGPRGLTQARGIDLSDCDTNEPAPAPTDAQGLCPAARATPPETFVANKGFPVVGAAVPAAFVPASGSGAAFVLVSHGATGHGAFLVNGAQEPSPGSEAERANAGASGPFRMEPHDGASGAPASAGHFDDELLAATITAVAAAAGLAARDWPEAEEEPAGGGGKDEKDDKGKPDDKKEKEDKEDKKDKDEGKNEGEDRGNGWAWGQDKEGREEWKDGDGDDDKARGRN